MCWIWGLELEDGFGRHWSEFVNWELLEESLVLSLEQLKPV